MEILVTGATGFIGNHLVNTLLERNHQIFALARNVARAKKLSWYPYVNFIEADIGTSQTRNGLNVPIPDAVVHLAWHGLPNYYELYHYEINLMASYHFLKNLIMKGVKKVLVAGTCFEYGLQYGALAEEHPAQPVTPYAIAKDSLRKFLFHLKQVKEYTLQWARIFYLYGDGQPRTTLLSQLESAIINHRRVFNMTGGEQLRDYLHVKEAALYLAKIIENESFDGIVNVCSGKPISIRRLVEDFISDRNADTTLNLGYYPYPDYEPLAFWGNNSKLKQITGGLERK